MASIRAHMILDATQWVQGTTRAGRAMSGLESTVLSTGLRIGGAAVAAGALSSKAYADLDRDSRRTVALLDQRTEKFLAGFIGKSRELAVQWGVNVKEIVSASYQAFSLGRTWENYTEIMETAIKATKTYGGTLNDNINLLLKFERILGLSSERIMDLAASTIQLGDTKLEFLSQYMTEVTGIAKNLELPEAELFTLFAAGTVQQRDTMKVTTGLKALLGQFLRPESGLSKGLKEAFGVGFREAIKDKNFVELLTATRAHLGAEGFEAAVGANVDAANIALSLADMPRLFDSMLERIENSQGKFAKDADFALMSPAQRYDEAVARLADLKLTLGQKALPGVVQIAESLKKIITQERIEAFISLGDALTKSIPTFAALAAALSAAGSANIGGYSVLEMMLFASLGSRAGRRLGGAAGGARAMSRGSSRAAAASTVASTAAAGAVTGAAFGPWGAAIGGGLGLIGGYLLDRWGQSGGSDAEDYPLPGYGDPVNPSIFPGFGPGATSDQEKADRAMMEIISLLRSDQISAAAKEKLVLSVLYKSVRSPYNPENVQWSGIASQIPAKRDDLTVQGITPDTTHYSSSAPMPQQSTMPRQPFRFITETGHVVAPGRFRAGEDGRPEYIAPGTLPSPNFSQPPANPYIVDGSLIDVTAEQILERFAFNPETGEQMILSPITSSLAEQWDIERTYWDGVQAQYAHFKNREYEAQLAGNEIAQEQLDATTESRGTAYTRGRYAQFNFRQVDNRYDETLFG